jgi:hypothetical protein
MADARDVHGAGPSQQRGTERDTRGGTATSVRHNDSGLFDALRCQLGEELLGCRDIPEHAGGVGAADREGRHFAALGFGLGDQLA